MFLILYQVIIPIKWQARFYCRYHARCDNLFVRKNNINEQPQHIR